MLTGTGPSRRGRLLGLAVLALATQIILIQQQRQLAVSAQFDFFSSYSQNNAQQASDRSSAGSNPSNNNSNNNNNQYHARRERVSWCTTSLLERKKCLDWARAIEDTNIQFEGQEPFKMNLDCVQGADKDQCMGMIDDERADMILLDPGEIGVAGRYHSLTPIMLERYGGGGGGVGSGSLSSMPGGGQFGFRAGASGGVQAPSTEYGHYSVAVVKKRSAASIQSLGDLYGRRACFSGVSHMASWILPLASLIDLPRFEIADCNNLVKSASYFFGNSCAPNALINKFNPTGDNPQKMSLLCERHSSVARAQGDTYEGAFSALKCLAEWPQAGQVGPMSSGGNSYLLPFAPGEPPRSNLQQQQQQQLHASTADVAFLPHNTLFLAEKLSLARDARLEVPSRNELELLCPQGGRAPLERWQSCNFGFAPAHAIIVSSRTSPERRESIQRFLKTSVQLFSSGTFASTAGTSPQGPLTSSSLVASQQQQQQQQQQRNTFDQQVAAAQRPIDAYSAQPPSYFSSGAVDQMSASSRASSAFGQQVPAGGAGLANYGKLNTNFKLNGDAALLNYPSLDVLFSSDMVDLVPLSGVGQTFKGFLNSFPVQLATSASSSALPSPYQSPYESSSAVPGARDNSALGLEVKQQTDYFEKLRRCPLPAAVVCVSSDKEFSKCQAMSKAFHAAGLKPELNCKLAQSSLACMQLIKNRDADLVVLDAADIYLAGSKFNLIPIVAEQIEMSNPSDYAVAVAKKSDLATDLFNLKGKMSCHSGFLKGAGWVMPMNFLLANDRMRRYDSCNSARSAAEHFDKSCAPGILSSVSNVNNNASGSSQASWTIRNMCELCHGTGRGYCARDASEPFYGDTGSFRCLIEGGGQVAFCKHTAIFENTGGSNRETWARNLIKSDFELLCRDGSRAPVSAYKTCNLGRVPPNAMVTRGDTPFQLIDTYVNLFMYGQQYYGSKYSEEYTFKMFSSTNGRDLIFQDATQQLIRVPLANQTYRSYLDNEFLRAIETVFCI